MRKQSDHSLAQVDSSFASVPAAYLDSTFIALREGCWQPIENKRVFVGCGDDRPITKVSANSLGISGPINEVLHPLLGYASIYGGVAGEAKNVLVVGAALHGPKFISDVGGFDGIMDLLIQGGHNPQTLHSAVGNENDQRHFCMQGDTPIGCAYCAGIGFTSDLLVDPKEEAIRMVAHADQKYVFGSDQGFESLLQGHRLVLEHATAGKGSGFACSRDRFITYAQAYGDALGIMILDGTHAATKTSGVISNFSLDEVGNAQAAHEQNLDFYRLDIAIVTDIVLKSLEQPLRKLNSAYVLPPEMLARAFQLDSVPVRAVLVSQDQDPSRKGKLDPSYLPIGVRGDQFRALQVLKQRQEAGYYGSATKA